MTSPQAQSPLGSGFTAASTATEVLAGVDLTGKNAIVTGGYAGLGLETARALRAAGANVVVPARDLDKARRALASIEGGDRIELEAMDLLDPASIDSFAARFVASGRPLHMLVNSAGIMATPLARDARGYESQLATNHLGHFQLVRALRPALLKAGADGEARVVSVSSRGHRYSPFVFEDPNFERRAYDPFSAYGQSKTANVLFAVALDTRGKEHGIRAFAVHPGTIVDTDLGRHVGREQLQKMGVVDAEGKAILDPARNLKTVAQGASTSVWCAASPQLRGKGGVYCENTDVSPIIPPETLADPKKLAAAELIGVMPHAIDPEAAERLWTVSGELLRPR